MDVSLSSKPIVKLAPVMQQFYHYIVFRESLACCDYRLTSTFVK